MNVMKRFFAQSRFLQWFRRWLVSIGWTLFQEVAEQQEEAVVWHLLKMCYRCHLPIGIAARYCDHCGVSQMVTEPGWKIDTGEMQKIIFSKYSYKGERPILAQFHTQRDMEKLKALPEESRNAAIRHLTGELR